MAKNLVKIVKFRNLLIHLYSKVNYSEVYKILKENLRDVKNMVIGFLLIRKEIEFSIIFESFLENLPFEDIDIGIYLKKIIKKSIKLTILLNLG